MLIYSISAGAGDQAYALDERRSVTPLQRFCLRARTGFTTMILQKFARPLGATCFTEKECSSIQSKLLPAALPKMGVNRSTPAEARSAPAHFASRTVDDEGSSKNALVIGQAGTSWSALSRGGALARSCVDHCLATRLWELND